METKDPQLYSDLDKEGQLKEFKATNDCQEYLMKPISGNGKLTIHKLGATELHPHLDTDLFFEEFGLELNEQQYEDILWTASKFRWYSKTAKFRKFRPKVSPSEDPKAWFKYAAECVLNEIHEKNYKWSWDHFAKRRDERKDYIKLWKLKLEKKLNEDEQNSFRTLNRRFPLMTLSYTVHLLGMNLERKEVKLNFMIQSQPKRMNSKEKDGSQVGGEEEIQLHKKMNNRKPWVQMESTSIFP